MRAITVRVADRPSVSILPAALRCDGRPPYWSSMSVRQKDAKLLPLVRHATDCIVRKGFRRCALQGRLRPSEINDLIVDPMSACVGPVRAMIDAHDRLYNSGSGEAFLLGPYLDILPAVVVGQVKAPQR